MYQGPARYECELSLRGLPVELAGRFDPHDLVVRNVSRSTRYVSVGWH